jgi:hypothetical protein
LSPAGRAQREASTSGFGSNPSPRTFFADHGIVTVSARLEMTVYVVTSEEVVVRFTDSTHQEPERPSNSR